MHPQRLASLNFRRPADAAVVVLTVQVGARLTGEQMKRPPRRLLPLPGGLLFIPPRMARAFAIAKPGDGGGKEFNLAGGGGERIALRIGAKIGEKICGRSGALYSSTPCCQKSSNEGSAIPLLLRPRS